MPFWRMFGLDMKDTIQRFERDLLNQSFLRKNETVGAKQLAYTVRDFNVVQTEWDYDDFCFVPILSARVGEVVIVTNGPNRAGWCEGYMGNRNL